MTNYNDGKWHGWNGGKCPVHLETEVDFMREDGSLSLSRLAMEVDWDHYYDNNNILVFRVAKEYKELREFWVVIYDGTAWDTEDQAYRQAAHSESIVVHVREVIE